MSRNGNDRTFMKSALGIVTMFRNEGPYLVEWIEYHRIVGVDHFWLYDNGSTDEGPRRLQPYIAKGIVELTPWPTADNPPRRRERIVQQLNAAKDGFAKARGKVEWATHIDVDEFLLPMQERDVPACLKKHFSEASGVYVNWRMFGTSGVTIPLGDPILPKLTSCAVRDHPENSVGKSIVRPEHVDIDAIWYVHHFPLLSGFYLDGGKNRLSFNVHNDLVKNSQHFDTYLRINHYNLRDEYFYRTRRLPDAERGRLDKKLDRVVQHHDDFNKDWDNKIVKYLKREPPTAYREGVEAVMTDSPFGGWAISKQLFDWLLEALPEGSTILELGSGSGTQQLAKHFRMISVEHDREFVGRYDSTYIYAPIVEGWYDSTILAGELGQLSTPYDLLLIDGPPQSIGRSGILQHLELFDLTKSIVLDDVHRAPERALLDALSKHVGRPHEILSDGKKSFGVL